MNRPGKSLAWHCLDHLAQNPFCVFVLRDRGAAKGIYQFARRRGMRVACEKLEAGAWAVWRTDR